MDKPSTNGRLDLRPPTRPVITTGAVSSAPESSQSSSDDEHNSKRGRVRELANLSELQAAIRIIEQHRKSSPDRTNEETKKARMTLGLDPGRSDNLTKDLFAKNDTSPHLPLSAGARKISHSRSSTDASPLLDFTRQNSDSPPRSESDCEDLADDELQLRPTMVRKKSGELVRPALRPASAKRRPSSMPGTPTYSKAVHFDSRLEHVRHFLQVDRPLAVSAGSSPVDSSFEDELEFPFGGEDARPKSPPFEWEIRLTNSPASTAERNSMPVRVERVFLSSDNKTLMGAIAAKNIAFHKSVVARFTTDYWKTTSEVVADYNNNIRRKQINDDCDRFLFSITLEDHANLENKTLFFCVRYNVNGQEFWDNNNSFNFQVDFSKKAKPINGKSTMQGNMAKPLNGLPRSKPSPRPRVSRELSDDFASGSSPYEFSSFPQPATIVGDSPIRFRKTKSANDIASDAPGCRGNATGQGFSNRYDFGASISAAIQMASATTGEVQKQNSFAPTRFAPPSAKTSAQTNGEGNESPQPEKLSGVPDQTKPTAQEHSKPAALTAEKPSLQSSSYHELLDKYCFVRSRIEKDGKENIC